MFAPRCYVSRPSVFGRVKLRARIAEFLCMAPDQVDRLRAIIETQTEIARTKLDLDAVMDLVVRRAQDLTDATAGVMELVEDDKMVYSG